MNAVNQVQEASAVYAVEQHALLKSFDLLATAPDAVARLRELILSLAVQGKLVPQDPKDEPASVLLERIRAEKQALIKAGKLKKDKPLAEIAEEEKPFELPQRWEWVRLGDVVDVVRGITFPASEKTREPAADRIACLRTANVQDQIEWGDLLFVKRTFMSRDEQLIQPSDIVMSMANSRELVGKAAIVKESPVAEATIGGFLSVLRPRFGLPQFLMVILRTQYARQNLIDSSSQTTNIANISLGKLNPLLIPIPPLAEQSRIVARVEELMQLCDSLEQQGRLEAAQHARLVGVLFDALANSESAHTLAENWQCVAASFDLLLDRPEAVDALEQTLLQLAVRGLLVPQDPNDEPASELLKKIRQEKDHLIATGKLKRDKPLPEINEEEKPFELPQGWEWTRLGVCLERLSNGYNGAQSKIKTEFPLTRIETISKSVIDMSKVGYCHDITNDDVEKFRLFKGDILLSHINSGIHLGKTAIFNTEELLLHGVNLLLLRPSPYVNPNFINLAINCYRIQGKFQAIAQHAIGQQSINQAKVTNVEIALPPSAEQTRIVARVAELRQLCADLRARLTAARSTQTHLAEALVEQAA